MFGFLIGIAGFLSIKVTSPVSHMISAAVRGVLQTFLGIWIFGDVVSSLVSFLLLSPSPTLLTHDIQRKSNGNRLHLRRINLLRLLQIS